MTRSSIQRGAPVTPQIIQGTWGDQSFPKDGFFASNCRVLADSFRGARYCPSKHAVSGLFHVVETRTLLLHKLSPSKFAVVPLLIQLASLRDQWVRDPFDWQPPKSTTGSHLTLLVRRLFERYQAPYFFKRSWWPARGESRDWECFGWYIHVARGRNIRNAPGIPTQLTRRAAHEFIGAPRHLTARVALRWAQLRALGTSKQLTEVLLSSRAGQDFEHDDVWLPLFAKLASEPALPLHQVSALIDYVDWHRAEDGFTLKRRSAWSLLNATARWHLELGRVQNAGTQLCDEGWNATEGIDELHQDGAQVVELLSFDALHAEGSALHHCVVTYADERRRNENSLWSLRIDVPNRVPDRATICVRSNRVAEASSYCNQPLSKACFALLKQWAKLNQLSVAPILVAS